MYNFEKRLRLTKKSYEDLLAAQTNSKELVDDGLEVFIILARTITFVMKKELNSFHGFSNWYLSKQEEIKERYQYFVDIRNKIEKEGLSPVKSAMVEIRFFPYAEAKEKVGIIKHPNGRDEDVLGQIENMKYFDKEQKKEIITSCKEYLEYLEILVSDAVNEFPEAKE